MLFLSSDLHYGLSLRGDASTRELAAALCRQASRQDSLALAGDLAADDTSLLRCLDLFRDFPGLKCAIPGNHDVWVGPGQDSWERYCRLKGLMESQGFHPLHEEPVITSEGTGLVGNLGWYDGSFGDSSLGYSLEDYARKIYPGPPPVRWGDSIYVRWNYTDKEMTLIQVDRLREHLQRLQDFPRVVAVLHHLPTRSLLWPRWLLPRKWRFMNTFLGSDALGEVLRGFPNITQVFCGHVHMQRKARLGHLPVMSIGSTYEKKTLLAYDGQHVRSQSF